MQTATTESTENFTLFECFGDTYAIPTENVREIIFVREVHGVPPNRKAKYCLGMVNVRGNVIGTFGFREMIDPERCAITDQKPEREYGAILTLRGKVIMLVFDNARKVVIVKSDAIHDSNIDATGLINKVARIMVDETDISSLESKEEKTILIIDTKRLAEILNL